MMLAPPPILASLLPGTLLPLKRPSPIRLLIKSLPIHENPRGAISSQVYTRNYASSVCQVS